MIHLNCNPHPATGMTDMNGLSLSQLFLKGCDLYEKDFEIRATNHEQSGDALTTFSESISYLNRAQQLRCESYLLSLNTI